MNDTVAEPTSLLLPPLPPQLRLSVPVSFVFDFYTSTSPWPLTPKAVLPALYTCNHNPCPLFTALVKSTFPIIYTPTIYNSTSYVKFFEAKAKDAIFARPFQQNQGFIPCEAQTALTTLFSDLCYWFSCLPIFHMPMLMLDVSGL